MIAHELGHVRSRHILKAIGWSALVVVAVAVAARPRAARRRGGVGDPANLPYAFLVLTVLGLLVTRRARTSSRAATRRRPTGAR